MAPTTWDGRILELSSPLAAVIYGIAIVGAAFILSWAAEAAQVDINGGLALALLAFLAVLPEYAVDFVFTMRAGLINAEHGHCMAGADGSNPCSLALANMTGAPQSRRYRLAAGGARGDAGRDAGAPSWR